MVLLMLALAQGAEPCDDSLYWSHAPAPSPWYDDENCYVEHPLGEAFVYANQFYTFPDQNACAIGWFDGANCYVQPDRPGSFVLNDTFYTVPWASGGVQCPTGSWFDGANCYWIHAPGDHEAFIYDGGWYTTPGPSCADGIYDGANCYHGAPAAGSTAFVLGNGFYYSYDEVQSADALRHPVDTCGDSYDASDLDGCVNAHAPLRPSIERGISTPEADYHGLVHHTAQRNIQVTTWVDGCQPYAGTTTVGLGPALPVDDTTRSWPRSAVRAGDTVTLPYSRTSNDGRIALVKHRAFMAFRPDEVSYDDQAPGTSTFGWAPSIPKTVLGMSASSAVYHSTICDVSGGNVEPGVDLSQERNPRTCTWTEPGHAARTGDCYDLTLLYAPEGYSTPNDRWWMGSIDVTVFVSDPKTTSAATTVLPRMGGTTFTTAPLSDSTPNLASYRSELRSFWLDVDADGVQDPGEIWNGCDGGTCGSATLPAGPDRSGVRHESLDVFELTTTADGRLLILNAMDGLYYSYNSGTACHAEGFSRWLPLSHMPFDPDVAHLDLAKSGAVTGGFRDVTGNIVHDKHRFVGAYPWVDRQAKNLFFARTNPPRDGWVGQSGYPGHSPNESDDMDEINGKGVVVMGAWTQGKMVHLDNMLNPTDWGGVRSCESLLGNDSVKGGGAPLRAFDVSLYRDGEPLRVRPGASSLLGGPENQFNHLDGLSPTLPFDVVWRMSSNNGHTAEMAFDEYMRNDAFVVAHMNAAQKPQTLGGQPNVIPWDGFTPMSSGGDDFAVTENPHVQNASTASTAWDPTAVEGPTQLRLRGGARIEPVALGGVLGKGVYLDGRNDFIDMGYRNTGRADWSYSIWLDLRTIRPGDLRTVFHWADGSWLAMSETTLRASDGASGITQDIDISHLGLESGRYLHLSVDSFMDDSDRVLEVHLNGDPRPVGTLRFEPVCTWSCYEAGFSMDRAGGGWSWFVVGSYGGEGVPPTFRGWVDELRVYALTKRTAAFQDEVRCNLALGTLRRDPMRYQVEQGGRRAPELGFGPEWCEQLQLVSHDTPTEVGPQRGFGVCVDEVHRNGQSSTSLCARASFLGLAGKIPTAGSPRPDQSSNDFCLSCHSAGHAIDGLDISVLSPLPLNRECDGRRQPMDWIGVMGGAAPAPMLPGASSCSPGPNAWLADPWLDLFGKIEP